MRNFRELEVWNIGVEIAEKVYELAAKLPAEEKFGLKSQLQRSAVSIPSNIAEGCSRDSNAEFKRYLQIAIGSSYELETQLILTRNLRLLNAGSVEVILERVSQEQRKLNSFIGKVRAQQPNSKYPLST
ncbi:MAG: four helix bundle protein [Ignavibacteriales bacterium]|nr:four helix bundle protein [Ignavibacteriales bacterium]